MKLFSKKYRGFTLLTLITLVSELALTFALEPVYLMLYSDVVMQGTLITAILYYAIEILNPLLFTLTLSVVCAAPFCLREDEGMKKLYVASSFVILFIKYLCKLLSVLIFNGADAMDSDDFVSVIVQLLLDWAVIVLALLIAHYITKKHLIKWKTLDKAYRLSKMQEFSVFEGVYPIEKFISVRHVCLSGLFWSVIAQLGLSVLSTVYYDLFFFGLPQTGGDWIDVIGGLLGIVISYVLSYVLGFFVIRSLLKANSQE